MRGFLRLSIWAASALVPAGLCFAQERISQDPHDSVRSTNEALLSQIPESCVASVMNEASEICPNSCMIRVPNSELPKADACDKRTWVCDWPVQPITETPSCTGGWNGTYTQDRLYALENCGQNLRPTDKTKILSVDCTRLVPETKVEPCPPGGQWSGAGVTYIRYHHEALENDMTSFHETSVSPWTVQSVDCRRTVTRTMYEYCPLSSGTCTQETSADGAVVSSNCPPTIPSPRNTSVYSVTQYLANDLVNVFTENFGTTLSQTFECVAIDYCPGCADGEGGGGDSDGIEGGDGGGGGGGDGCPLLVDFDERGFSATPLENSHTKFDWMENGVLLPTAWIAQGYGILAHDSNHNGIIDGVSEFYANKRSRTGFDDLAREDSNHDSLINADDTGWKHIRVWKDLNFDGISEPSEVFSMQDAGIIEISLKVSPVDLKTPGARSDAVSTLLTTHGKRTVYEAYFTFKPDKKQKP